MTAVAEAPVVHGEGLGGEQANLMQAREEHALAEAQPFDPSRGLIKIEGKGRQANEYLPVNWRVLWLRTDHPLAKIVTEQIQLSGDWAVFKATITLANGAVGTGFGSQTKAQFPSFLEKAETKAIGRACAALGYGTLAAFEEGESIADAPVARPQGNGQNGHAPAAEEWDWPKLWAWLKPRGVADRAGLDYAARRPTEGLAPGEIKRVIDAVDRLVKMSDDELTTVASKGKSEGLRLSAAHEYCRRADDMPSFSGRYGQVAPWLTKEQQGLLYRRHAERLGFAPPAAQPAATTPDDPPWDEVVGPPANAPAELSTADKGKQPATDAQLLAIQSLAKQRGLSQETVLQGMKALFPAVPALKQLTRVQAGQLIDDIRRSHPAEEATS